MRLLEGQFEDFDGFARLPRLREHVRQFHLHGEQAALAVGHPLLQDEPQYRQGVPASSPGRSIRARLSPADTMAALTSAATTGPAGARGRHAPGS